MNRPVLAAVDSSPESCAAAHWAAQDALRRDVPLRLVHASPWLTMVRSAGPGHDDPQAAAVRMLSRVEDEIRRRHPALAVGTSLVGEEVVDALVSAAEGGEMLVLGSRGLGGFAGLLVGSVGLATAARAQVPVILVRSWRRPEDIGPVDAPAASEILVGVDARASADAVLEFAFTEAVLRGVRLRVVHSWGLPMFSAFSGSWPSRDETVELRSVEAKLLADALLPWRARFPGCEVVEEVRLGGAAEVLVEASALAQLVVVGRRSGAHGTGWHLGPVTHAVIHYAQGPTAVIPHP